MASPTKFTAPFLVVAVLWGCGGEEQRPAPPPPVATPAATPAPQMLVLARVVGSGEAAPPPIVAVEVYGAELRQLALPMATGVRTLLETLAEQRKVLRESRNALALASRNRVALEAVQEELKTLKEDGSTEFAEQERLDKGVAYFNQVRADFVRLGPNNMPVQDPLGGEPFVLNAHDGRRAASLALIDERILIYQRQRSARAEKVGKLRQRLDALLSQEKDLVADSAEHNQRERTRLFHERLSELQATYLTLRQTLADLQRLRENAAPMAKGESDKEGVLQLEAPIADSVLLAATPKEALLPAADLLWVMPLDGSLSANQSVTLSNATATLSSAAVREALPETDRYVNSELLHAADGYSASYPEPTDTAFAEWVDRLLRD